MIDKEFRMYTTAGVMQFEVSMGDSNKYGGYRMVYRRQDLHNILKDAATSQDRDGPPAVIRCSSRVLSCDPEAGIVTLEQGETLSADLIIGADGIVTFDEVSWDPVMSRAQREYLRIDLWQIPMEELEEEEDFVKVIQPRESFTTMIIGHDRRMIMGPVRRGEAYSIVALVPDDLMHEDTTNSTWTTEGDLNSCLQSFSAFPEWARKPFHCTQTLGLWQLRDLNPLPTWFKGTTIIIGDAAHAMLPTQGQGASQSIEDAEAIGAFFSDVAGKINRYEVNKRLEQIFDARHERASLIQAYSRQQAKPGTKIGDSKIELDPEQFMRYNCDYNGAKDWYCKHRDVLAKDS